VRDVYTHVLQVERQAAVSVIGRRPSLWWGPHFLSERLLSEILLPAGAARQQHVLHRQLPARRVLQVTIQPVIVSMSNFDRMSPISVILIISIILEILTQSEIFLYKKKTQHRAKIPNNAQLCVTQLYLFTVFRFAPYYVKS